MNKIRRKELARIVAELEKLEYLRLEIKERLWVVLEEEQEALDNMPEALREGVRGEMMQEYIDALENALDDLDEIDIDNVHDQLYDICG